MSSRQKDVFSRVSLMACPFCNGAAVMTKYEGWPSSYRVRCADCSVHTAPSIIDTEVTDTWNTRAALTPAEDDKAQSGMGG